MSEERFKKFEEWYDEAKNRNFHLPTELRLYCQNDTEILQAALLAFRRIFITECTGGFDVLHRSSTLASVCLNIYKALFMPENQIALVPERGFERQDRASVLAIRYLEWRSMKESLEIQHAGNGGEKCIAGYKLDGWIPEQSKAIEFHGCYYHG